MEGNSNGIKENTKPRVNGSQRPPSSRSVNSQTKKKQFTPKIPEQPQQSKTASSNNNDTTGNNNNVNDGIIRIKRKRDDSALDSFVIEDEPDYKRVTLSSITDKLSQVTVDADKKPTYHFSETTPPTQPLQPPPKLINRKLFRFAYTITDTEKLKEHNKGLLKIQSITKRDQVVSSKRGQPPSSSTGETYVIDVYVQDTDVKPDSDLMDQFDVVRLESFKEDLVFDNEYDTDGSEDSNAENHYGNEYPDEDEFLSDESFSDDSEKENVNSRIRFDSDDEIDDYDDPYVKPDLSKFEKFLKNNESENSSDEDAMESDTRKSQPPIHLTFTPQRSNGKSQPNNVFHTLKNQQIAAKKKEKQKMTSYLDEEPNADDYNYEIASSSDSDFEQ